MSTYPIEFKDLEEQNKRLIQAIKNVPTDEYGRAEREGADSCGAWDSFLEKLAIWQDQALNPQPPEKV